MVTIFALHVSVVVLWLVCCKRNGCRPANQNTSVLKLGRRLENLLGPNSWTTFPVCCQNRFRVIYSLAKMNSSGSGCLGVTHLCFTLPCYNSLCTSKRNDGGGAKRLMEAVAWKFPRCCWSAWFPSRLFEFRKNTVGAILFGFATTQGIVTNCLRNPL